MICFWRSLRGIEKLTCEKYRKRNDRCLRFSWKLLQLQKRRGSFFQKNSLKKALFQSEHVRLCGGPGQELLGEPFHELGQKGVHVGQSLLSVSADSGLLSCRLQQERCGENAEILFRRRCFSLPSEVKSVATERKLCHCRRRSIINQIRPIILCHRRKLRSNCLSL